MAKLKAPFFSFGASGRLGRALTVARRLTGPVWLLRGRPTDPKSTAQQQWRHMYQKAIALWHALSESETREWELLGTQHHMTGYAYFLSQALRPNPGLYLPLQGGIMTGDIDMDGHAITDLPLPVQEGDAARKGYVDDLEYTDADAVAAAEAAGLALASGKNIKLIANLTSDQTCSGLTAVLQAGETIFRTQVCYVKDDGKLWRAQSNAAATMPAVAMACAAILNADDWGEFLLIGFYREDSLLTFTLGDMLYVSDTVAGSFDNVLPDAGDFVQVLGKCLHDIHTVYFNPSLELVKTPA